MDQGRYDDGPEEAFCDKHGTQIVTDFKRTPGFCGPIYVWTLSCGCQVVDASDDVPEP